MNQFNTSLELPDNFRVNDFLAFHQRDSHMLAETVTGQQLQKGLYWNGVPGLLALSFAKKGQVEIQLHLDKSPNKKRVDADLTRLQQHAKHMLGLNQDVPTFEKQFQSHPQLGQIIQQNTGLRVPQSATPFEALSWAITGQQISVKAAISLRRKFILCAGTQHSSGLWCYPDAQHIAGIDVEILRDNGFSQTKATTLINFAQEICNENLPLEQWLYHFWQTGLLDAKSIYDNLIQLRGIGPWTVNYALLRGFGWMDGSLHGDVAVRNQLQRLLLLAEKPDEKATTTWLNQFSPWRALVAAHLWHWQ